MSIRDLDFFFKPSSVAVIGASKRPGSVGAVLMENLMRGGFDGPVMPVNPKHGSIGGALAWPTVDALPVTPELGVVCTPPDTVADVVGALQAKGARATIVITAGFGEGGAAEGEARRRAVLEQSRGMRLIGPNVVGVLAPGAGLNASFAHIAAQPGDLAFVSQSGAIITSVLDWAAARGIGFSHMVSLGDMADVDFGDMLDYLALQPNVRAILLYIEAVTNARKFLSAARIAARAKPVVVIKAGRAPEGARAAHSHTGALAGHDAVYDAVFHRAGLLRVQDTIELFEAVETLAHAQRFRGDRLAILSNGGGVAVLATDRAVAEGVRIADLAPDTIARLDEVLPPTWSRGNPVDIIGDAPGSRYANSLEVLLEDSGIDAVLVLNCPTAVADSMDAARAVIECGKDRTFPVLTNWLGSASAAQARRAFSENGMPTYDTPEAAVRGFAHLVRYRAGQERLLRVPLATSLDHDVDRVAAAAIFEAAHADGRDWLMEAEAKSVLDAYGIPVVPTAVATTPAEAEAAARDIPGPYAVKIYSPDILHKTDVGGVHLDIETPEGVAQAAETMEKRVREAMPEARIYGVTVQSMVRRSGAFELITGIFEDPQFGPIIMFGEGGTGVEAIGDTAMALPPLDGILAEELIERTRIGRLLPGYRGRAGAHLPAVTDALIRVSRLAADFDGLRELDINPLLADAEGVIAIDARIRFEPAATDHGARLAIKPYPNELRGEVVLRDGTPVDIRPIAPTDAPRLQDMISRTDPHDIRLRFLHSMQKLPDKLAARLSQIDYAREMAFVALDESDGSIVGVSRLVGDANNERAEYAVIVRSDWKGRGLGFALMNRLIDHARGRGLRELFGEVLAENSAMLAMCRELGFDVAASTGDRQIRDVTLTLS